MSQWAAGKSAKLLSMFLTHHQCSKLSVLLDSKSVYQTRTCSKVMRLIDYLVELNIIAKLPFWAVDMPTGLLRSIHTAKACSISNHGSKAVTAIQKQSHLV